MTLAELIRRALDVRLAQVRVAIPARVESYDASAQTVDVKPLIKDKLLTEDGAVVESLPVLTSVPVAFPRGGGFFISLPIAAGDTGRVVVCDRSIDQWMKKGGEVDPLDMRMHSWGGAVFEPDLASTDDALADAHAQNLVIGFDGGVAIHLTPGGQVHVGKENPTKFAARKTDAVQVTIPAGTFLTQAQAGVPNPTPIVVDGQITGGSATVKIDD